MKKERTAFHKLLKKLFKEEDRDDRFFSLVALAEKTLLERRSQDEPGFLKERFNYSGEPGDFLSEEEKKLFISSLPDRKAFSIIRESFLKEDEKKENGRFFTNSNLAKALLRNYSPGDVCPRVLDLCCGSGSLLEGLIEKLLPAFSRESLEENLHAWDMDEKSLLALEMDLYFTYGLHLKPGNIKKINVLTQDLGNETFELILLNPPYIGSREGARLHPYLKEDERFKPIYKKKSDLSYCFYPLCASLLDNEGELFLLTSRYFMEADGAEGLRRYIGVNFHVRELTDLYGQRVASWPGVDLVLMRLEKTRRKEETEISRFISPGTRGLDEGRLLNALENQDKELFYFFKKKIPSFGKWRVHPPNFSFYEVAEEEMIKEGVKLSQIADSFQGIITGCDEAFVREGPVEEALMRFPVRGWVKSREILHGTLEEAKRKIIYISKNDSLSSSEREALAPFEEKLKNRREVRSGKIPWWAIQWEREIDKFNAQKIIWPYKAERNAFCVDEEGRLFSADVYAMTLKGGEWDAYALCALLNTDFYDTLFKLQAKKLGGRLYEYYPHSVMDLPIPNYKAFHEKAAIILEKEYKNGKAESPSSVKRNTLYDKIYKLKTKDQEGLTAFYDRVLREMHLYSGDKPAGKG